MKEITVIMKKAGRLWLAVQAALLVTAALATTEDYYKGEQQFHPWPDAGAPRYTIKRFGPVGITLLSPHESLSGHLTRKANS